MSPTREPVIDGLDEVWTSIISATEVIDASQWNLPTRCPGWSVRDHLSHLIGIERTLLGDPQPPPVMAPPTHVRNEIGAFNEAWVEERRGRPGPDVLAEWREVADRRMRSLEGLEPQDWDVVGPSPVGNVPYRRFMEVRVLDSWVHEQDVRDALGTPGGLGGAGQRQTVDHLVSLLPYVIGRKVRPPDHSTVVWSLEGPQPRRMAVGMEDGRGRRLDQIPDEPTVSLHMDEATFWCLGCGRISPEEASARVTLRGPADLGGRIMTDMNLMT